MFPLFSRPNPRDKIRLESERLYLRPLAVEDAEEMLVFARDPEVTRYLPWSSNTDLSMVQAFLREQINRRRRNESLGFAALLRSTGAMIGSTDLMDLKRSKGEAELGYILARPYWNRGLMTEAALLTRDYGINEIGLTRLHAWADSENLSSCRVLEKIGMIQTASETRLVKGEERSYVRYDISP